MWLNCIPQVSGFVSARRCEDLTLMGTQPGPVEELNASCFATCKNWIVQTRLLVREGAPYKITPNCKKNKQTMRWIVRGSQMGAWHQDGLADWLSVLMWLRLLTKSPLTEKKNCLSIKRRALRLGKAFTGYTDWCVHNYMIIQGVWNTKPWFYSILRE
jgi:hypothetical protein